MSPDPTSGPMPGVSTGGRSATRSRWTLAIVVAVLVAAALAADPVARRALSDGRVIELGLLQLRLAYNSGVAFRETDYFHTGWWPTFNLADTYLTCGVVLVVLASLREGRTRVDPTGTEQRSV